MKLSIIIVNYKSGALTHSCVESLLKEGLPKQSEIIIVDNGSDDDSVPFLRSDFPEATVIDTQKNLGLAGGVNQALRVASGQYYLLLNPDIIALPGAVKNLVTFMDKHPQVGLASGKLLSPNGMLQHSCYRFYTPMTIVYRRTWLGHTRRGKHAVDQFLMKDFNHQETRDVEWVMGSCMMLRSQAIKEVGGMDEQFFLYFEDVDWCRRFWEKGWHVTYVPSAQFSHFHQQSSRQQSLVGLITNWTTREHIRSAIKYFRKYRGKPHPSLSPTPAG